MALNERQDGILGIIKEQKKVTVTELASIFFVSEATIRRDLSEMKDMGLVERSHGGAFLPENSEEVSLFYRMERNPGEKDRAASKALPHIPPFKSVFIDSSSTALALAEKMDFSYKTVVTNNLQTAIQLSKKPNVTLILLGGAVQYNTNSTQGSWTAKQLEDFSFDLMLSSCACVIGGATHERSLDQKEIKRVAFERSQKRILIIDHTKFEASATYRAKELKDFDLVVTDSFPPPELDDGSINFVY
ncbi:MAG: DeoR/GlpR transcriptional regulator [Clostridia bacterium]|nr:DeoR/GlpR transcriptional regulator [Clostridia bacterium]